MEIFFTILFFSLLFTGTITVWFEKEKNYRGIGIFFILTFLPVWALALLLPPVGPVYAGIAWLDIFIMALLISLFIGAATPPHYYKIKKQDVTDVDYALKYDHFSRSTSLFFWAFVTGLLFLILIAKT